MFSIVFQTTIQPSDVKGCPPEDVGGVGGYAEYLAVLLDSIAAYPLSHAWSPADVVTTVLDALGVPPDAMVVDPLGRPTHLLNGEVIAPLFTGSAV